MSEFSQVMQQSQTSLWYSKESKREGKDQELIQSSTTPDPGYHMGK